MLTPLGKGLANCSSRGSSCTCTNCRSALVRRRTTALGSSCMWRCRMAMRPRVTESPLVRLHFSFFTFSRVVNVREEVATVRSSRAAKPRDQRASGGTWHQQQNASRSNNNSNRKRPASAGQGERQRLKVPTNKSCRSTASNSGFDPENLRHRLNHGLSSSSVDPFGSVSDNYDNDEESEMCAKSLCVPRAVNRVELVRREAQGGRPVSAGSTRGFGDRP